MELIRSENPDYWSYIEGDDKYLSSNRTQKHIRLLELHQSALISYNKLMLIDANSNDIEKHIPNMTSKVLFTEKLVEQNYIGSFCASFYRGKCFDHFDKHTFDGITVYDWFFNIYLSQFGEIRLLNEYLSGYRQHSKSVWSSLSHKEKLLNVLSSIDDYNERTKFKYDSSFQANKQYLISALNGLNHRSSTNNIIILSGTFPCDNKNKYEEKEIRKILEELPNSIVLVNGENYDSTGNDGIFENDIIKYKLKHAPIASRILDYGECYIANAKCLFAMSLHDTFSHILPMANKYAIPFIFEIKQSENLSTKNEILKLQKILSSPYFRKVLVPQNLAQRSFLDKKICKNENIELISNNMTSPASLRSKILKQCATGKLPPMKITGLKGATIYFKNKIKTIVPRRVKTLIKHTLIYLLSVKLYNKLKGGEQ
jgi:hypothetical protein